METLLDRFFQRVSKSFPALKIKLSQARMTDKPDEFIKKSIMSGFYMSFGIIFALFLIVSRLNFPKLYIIALFPFVFLVMSLYMLRLPDFRVSKQEKEISKEIVFAGRFIIIELESGVPLYNTMINVSRNFEYIGRYFKEIVDKINLGTSMEDALNEASEIVPSNDLRKVLWQVINSMRTGSNISKSLYSVVDQITRDQMTEVNKYGKKLNPLAMFYMIIAVILPSLGMTMLIILASFIEFELSLTILITIAMFMGFIQFIFISLVKLSRPAIEL